MTKTHIADRPLMILKFGRHYSHIGKRPVIYAAEGGVSVTLDAVSNSNVEAFNKTAISQMAVVKGPLGIQQFPIHRGLVCQTDQPGLLPGERSIRVSLAPGILKDLSKYKAKFVKSMWGTTTSILRQMVEGVSEGHQISLRLVGVGYKAAIQESSGQALLVLKLGYSHDVVIPVPQGIQATLPLPTKIVLKGINLQAITQFAAAIRSKRKPEPYNGKGIFVGEETIRLKEGKKSK